MSAAVLPSGIAAAASAIRAGELTATDLVLGCLGQIERLEGSINAFISVDQEGALARAADLDRRQADGLSMWADCTVCLSR